MKEFRSDEKELKPKSLKKTKFYELLYKQDRSYYIAKSNLFITFIFEGQVNNPSHATKLRLLIYALQHHLRNFFFDQSLNRNSFHLKASPK
jgi:secreted Zn-dependent insulinase-like peptidase